MDKEWMPKDRLSIEYKIGVESFICFALENGNDPNAISYPCKDCGNLRKIKVDIVKLHLLSRGINQAYHTWIWHGENTNFGNSVNASGHGEHHFFDHEPVDMVYAAYEGTDENLNEFSKSLEDAERALYPGCSNFTKLSGIVKLYNLKVNFGWSDNSFTELLTLFGQMLPSPNELPSSLYDAKKTLAVLGITYNKIHACPNDCILYRNEFIGPDEDVGLQGELVALTLESGTHPTAYGTVIPSRGIHLILHGNPLPKDYMRVSIDQALHADAKLPVPAECQSVGEAVGSHVAWPKHLIQRKSPAKKKKCRVEPQCPTVDSSTVPKTLHMLYCYAKLALQHKGNVTLCLPYDVVGRDVKVYSTLKTSFHFAN